MIINSAKTDPHKILPIRYPWARQYYKAAIANNWTPEEVSMQKDVEQWKSTRVLSEAERTAALYALLQQTTQVQIRFFIQVLQQMSKSMPMSGVLSPANFGEKGACCCVSPLLKLC